MTFDARQLSPTLKPARNTVAAASTQTGHTVAPRDGRSSRAIHTQRSSSQSSGGYTSGIAVKTSPRLKNQSETENASAASRSALRIESSRRQSTCGAPGAGW